MPHLDDLLAGAAPQAAGASTGLSQGAALVFRVARLVHGLSYFAGIQGIRALAWNVGILATFAVALPLLGALHF